LAPDEGTYASLTKWVALSRPADEFPVFSGGIYRSGRALILPASVLYRLGVSELNSVRIIASVYGLGSLLIFSILAYKLAHLLSEESYLTKNYQRVILACLLLYAFIPSHFLWSVLGLRESTNEFWLIFTFLTLFLFYKSNSVLRIWSSLLFALSIIMVYSSRVQVGWLLSIALLLYLSSQIKRSVSILLIAIVMVGTYSGYLLNLSNSESRIQSESIESIESTPNLSGAARNLRKQIDLISVKHKDNQFGAASVIETPRCPLDENTRLGNYLCLAYRSPFGSITFLFRPLPIIDPTSATSQLASAENFIWITMFLLLLFALIQKRGKGIPRDLVPSMIFAILYVAAAGVYEGNMGTAFRHKSIILWVLLILLAYYQQLNPQKALSKSRGKQTEDKV
jgi:hypothetical protein